MTIRFYTNKDDCLKSRNEILAFIKGKGKRGFKKPTAIRCFKVVFTGEVDARRCGVERTDTGRAPAGGEAGYVFNLSGHDMKFCGFKRRK